MKKLVLIEIIDGIRNGLLKMYNGFSLGLKA
jgi:hypothetical protein